MRFNPKARLDTSQVQDAGRGGGAGFPGGGMSSPSGMRIPTGGGITGLIIFLILAFFGGNQVLGGDPSTPNSTQQNSSTGQFDQCQTGEDANNSQQCRLVAITNSVQAFWENQYPAETNQQYQPTQTVPFSGSVTTQGCGSATADVGPFYCPNDQRVYLDLTFFKDLLENQLGAKDTAFTEAYVVAHEYGHHVENLLGVMGQVRTQQGPNSDAVKLELMADCLAGVWAKGAQQTTDDGGQPLISEITQADIQDGINAAQAVGDDSIQSRTSGQVNPDGWTHGSSQQRITAFNSGLREGTIEGCNYFNGAQAPQA